MVDEDAHIIESVRSGDVEAFAVLVERHKEQVYAVLRRLVGDPDLAEELAHSAFVRAYRSLGSFRGEARFATWVVQIAIHAARDHFRKARRNPTVSLDELQEQQREIGPLTETRGAYDPLGALGERELVERLERAIDGLPPDYRQAFVLRHLEDMSYEQIAQITGDSVGALKVRTHRARKLLKEALENESDLDAKGRHAVRARRADRESR